MSAKLIFAMKLRTSNVRPYKEKDTLEKKGTKKFQKRVAEEQEADKEITDYLEEEEHNNDNTPTIQELLR